MRFKIQLGTMAQSIEVSSKDGDTRWAGLTIREQESGKEIIGFEQFIGKEGGQDLLRSLLAGLAPREWTHRTPSLPGTGICESWTDLPGGHRAWLTYGSDVQPDDVVAEFEALVR